MFIGTRGKQLMKLEERLKCVWKNLEQDRDSTTFLHVRGKYDHPLYKCTYCSGKPDSCKDYISMVKLYKNLNG